MIAAAPSIRIGLATAILTAILEDRQENDSTHDHPQEPPQGEMPCLIKGLPDWVLASGNTSTSPPAPDRVTLKASTANYKTTSN